MSCRIMGRTVEAAALLRVEDILRERGVKSVSAAYIVTKKNIPAKDFYDLMGYILTEEDEKGGRFYRYTLAEKRERAIDCFTAVI
jgi:predicted enzyme involved in methoxymalonyl-ACP biosynthesis